jgi:hypothetical protein
LKRRCPKWARITHLDICNTSYGQKKGRESNWQFYSRTLKVGNRPDYFTCRRHVTCHWKNLSTRATTLVQTSLRSEVCTRSYSPAKLRDSQPWWFRDSWNKNHSDAIPTGRCRVYYMGGRSWFPSSSGRGESCESEVTRGSS